MGISGSGMSALARILFDRVVPVSGCEARESWPGCERSAATSSSASPRHLDHTDTFVFTTAINPGTRNSSPRGRAASWSCAGPPRWKTAGASR
jgi:UDP-N-acetylmuramate--alanine ligase